MQTWFDTLKRGLSRTPSGDRLASDERRGSLRANLQNLKPFVARHWRKGLLGALLILLGALLSLPIPLITRYLNDDVILGGQLGLLLSTVLLLAVVKGLGMLAEQLQRFYFARFEQQVLLDIQQDLLGRTLRFPNSFFDDQEVGYLMSRLSSDVTGLRWFFSSTLVYIVSNVLRFVGGAVLLFYLEWRLALAAVILLPALVVAVRYFSGKMRVLGHQGMEQQAQVSRRMQESLSAASLIKAFASEGREVDRIMSEQRQAFQVSLEQVAVGSVANVSITTIGDAARMVVLLAGGYLVIVGDWTLGSLLAFQSYLAYVYDPAYFLATANLQLQNALAALERISALYDIVPEETGQGLPVQRLRGEVELRDVSFAYSGGEPVLEAVSCRVQPGERVALVGPSGVGKTTLISLLLRFYQPTRGEIWFDGQPASAYELASLRQRIGYVAQSTLLLSGTVEENLRYGNPEASHEQVVRAARAAGIHEFIAGLPQGYASPVGERGVRLSEGQKQRLSIARALIKDPDILVLDEPTAALDSAVERSIFDALPAMVRDKTLFVVAHRLATVQDSDRILLLNEKRLVAVGTHQQLLAENDYYRSLVANQQILTPVAQDSGPGPGRTAPD
ncbi:MAG: ABC transporter ATP-binding protein [Anaerolineae bacterium]